MLTKLMKYEWMATARYLVPLYLAFAFISILSKVTFSIPFISEKLILVPPVIFFIYIVSLVVLIITTFLLIIMRFYKNLLTGEGYLMFTLPVKVRDLINSKLIIAIVWVIFCVISILASLLFVLPSAEVIYPQFKHFGLNTIFDGLTKFGTSRTIGFILFAGIALITNIIIFYAAIAIGQVISSNKVIGSVIAYVGIYTVNQAFSVITLLIAYLTAVLLKRNSLELMSETTQFTLVLIFGIFISTVGCIVFYIVTKHMLKKRLNLE